MQNQDGIISFGTNIDNTAFLGQINEMEKGIANLKQTSQASASSITGDLSAIGKTSGKLNTRWISELTSQIKHVTKELTVFEVAMREVTGSVATASEATKTVTDFAARTPFQLQELTQAFLTLASVGFVPTFEQLTSLGNLAITTGNSFDQLASAIAGGISGEFQQLEKIGISVAQSTNTLTLSFKDVETQIAMSDQSIRQYILSLGELDGVSGQFSDMQIRMDGEVKNVTRSLETLFGQIRNGQGESIVPASGNISDMVNGYSSLQKTLTPLTAAQNAYNSAIKVVSAINEITDLQIKIGNFITLSKTLNGATVAQKAFNLAVKSNIYIAIAAAVIALSVAIYNYIKSMDASAEAQRRVNDAVSEYQKNADELKTKTEQLMSTSKDETKTEFEKIKAYRELQKLYPELFANMSREEYMLQNNSNLKKKISELDRKKEVEFNSSKADEAAKRAQRAKEAYEQSSKDPNQSSMTIALAIEYTTANNEAKLWADKVKKDVDDQKYYLEQMKPIEVKIASLSTNIAQLKDEKKQIEEFFKTPITGIPETPWFPTFENPLLPIVTGNIDGQIDAKSKQKDSLVKVDEQQRSLAQIKKEITESEKRLKDLQKQAQGRLTPAIKSKIDTEQETNTSLKNDYRTATGKNFDSEKQREKDDAAKARQEAERKIVEETEKAQKREFEIRQAGIDMETNLDKKKRDQAQLNFDIQMAQLAKQTEEYKKALIDKEKASFVSSKEQKTFDPSKVDVSQIDTWSKVSAQTLGQKKDKAINGDEDAELQEMLKKYADYQTRRKELEDKAEKDRKKMITSGASNESIAMFDQDVQTEKDNLSLEFANRDETFVNFASKILKDSTEELGKMITTLEQDLQKSSGGQDTATIQAKLKMLKEETKVRKAEEEADKKNAPALKWKKSLNVMSDVIDVVDEIGNAFGGLDDNTKAVLSAAKNIASSTIGMIKNIQKLGELSMAATKDTSDATSKSIKGVEKASVILAIIGAAVQIATAIAGVLTKAFNKDDEKEEAIEGMQKKVENLEKSYEKLDKAIDKAYGSDKAKLIDEQEANLEQRKAMIEEQMRLEQSKSKKGRDDDKITEYQNELDSINESLEGVGDRRVEAIMGKDVQSAIDDFANAYIDAWASGEDKAKSAEKVTKDLIKGAIVQMIKTQMSPEVDALMDYLAGAVSGGIDSGEQQMIDEYTYRIQKAGEAASAGMEQFLKDDEEEPEEGVSGQLQAEMTEATASQLVGLWTMTALDIRAMKEVAAETLQYSRNGFQQASETLNQTRLIEANTRNTVTELQNGFSRLDEKLTHIENNTKGYSGRG